MKPAEPQRLSDTLPVEVDRVDPAGSGLETIYFKGERIYYAATLRVEDFHELAELGPLEVFVEVRRRGEP